MAIGNLSNKVFRAAWPMEKNSMLMTFLLAASSENPPIRDASRSPLSVRVSSDREIEHLAIMATVYNSGHFPTPEIVTRGARSSTDGGQLKRKQRRGQE